MNFSKSHFINELKKADSALNESLDSTSLNEAKEQWDDVDTLQDFSVLLSKIVKAVLPNLKKLEAKKLKGFEKLLTAFQNGLDDLSESKESVNEFFSIDPNKQAEFIKKAWYDGLHAGRTTTGRHSLKKWEKFAQQHRINEGVNEVTDSAGHPSRIKLRDPKTEKLNRINALYDAYTNLAKHMESSGAPQEKVDAMKMKADELMQHVNDM